ncbi:hypothetical protein CASFOL_032703 [Castilleja foliolosa]|uniref:MHD domain-containing protein n=1 Tax=Castilleja foliolosa TaxID=1961234 RepID=A0ABD3C2U3_9LAMI
MSCLALALQPANGPDILLQTREWLPPSRALMALSAFRGTRLSFAKTHHNSVAAGNNIASDPTSDSLGDDPLAASSGQVIVGVESRYRVVYRLVNSIYVLAVTTIDDSNNNVFECINIVNQAVSVIVTACRGVDVTPEKLGKKYAEIYMALDIVLRGVSSIRLAAMLSSMHGEGIAKMVHSAIHSESKIRGADSWAIVEPQAADHEASVDSFSSASFELPAETLVAGDEVAAATLGYVQQGEEKELAKVEEIEGEKDPFAASDKINKPEEMLMEGFKKDKDSGISDMSKALAGLEVTTLPPPAATESTHIGVEGFEGNYGGIEFSNDGSTLPEDFEGIDNAWGGGLDASEFVGPKKVPKDRGLGGLEFLETSEPPPAAAAKGGDGDKIEDLLVKKTEMKGPEMYVVEEISAEFRESLLARVGLMGILYLKTLPPKSSQEDKETEFSFKVEGTEGVKRFAMLSAKVSSVGNGLFHVRTAPTEEPTPIVKYSILPRLTPLPIRVRLVKRLSGTLLSIMIQYVSNPDLPVPLNDVTIVLKLPVDPTLLQVSPKAVLNRAERELKWHIDEIPVKGNPGRLRVRMPVDIADDDDGSDLEIVGYVKFSAQGMRSLSGISLKPASEGKTDFYETAHRYASGVYICN